MRRFLGGWQGFRKLGFASDDLYCSVQNSVRLGGRLGCFCILKTQGKQFALECGPIESEKKTADEYERVTHAILAGEIPQEDLDRIWHASEVFQRFEAFAEAIVSKGIEIPNATDDVNEFARLRRVELEKEAKESN